MALSPYSLASLDDIKNHLGIPLANTGQDGQLTRMLNAATEKIEKWTGRRLMQRTGIEEYRDGNGRKHILMYEWPVSNVSEVWVDLDSEFTDVTLKLDPSVYRLDLSMRGEGLGLVFPKRVLPKGILNIKLVYDGGYAEPPADLNDLCLWMVDFMYRSLNEAINVKTKGKNQETITFRDELPKIYQDTLLSYTRAEFYD